MDRTRLGGGSPTVTSTLQVPDDEPAQAPNDEPDEAA